MPLTVESARRRSDGRLCRDAAPARPGGLPANGMRDGARAHTVRRQADRRHRAGSARPGGGRRDRTDRRLIQLVCSLVIFGAALVVKLTLPDAAEAVRATLADGVGGGFDYRTAFATVGETLSDGGDIVTAFRLWTAELFGARPAGAGPAPAGETDGSSPAEADGEVTSAAPAAAWRAPLDASTAAVRVSDWEVSLSAEDALDDTAPVPFGTEVPERADYTWYPLPFAYTAPIQGAVSSEFGFRRHPVYGETRFHYGLDIAADTGAEIRCFADGTVLSAGVSDTYGYYLEVGHKGGFTSFYAHCSRLLAEAGQTVRGGESIAQVGM
ncbi:MAG: M23 family metallopeptidase, partial [Oscillospiraceae bacterium]|nr:M23 family metallopeptidase [Oscillospiraceae bacterium]